MEQIFDGSIYNQTLCEQKWQGAYSEKQHGCCEIGFYISDPVNHPFKQIDEKIRAKLVPSVILDLRH